MPRESRMKIPLLKRKRFNQNVSLAFDEKEYLEFKTQPLEVLRIYAYIKICLILFGITGLALSVFPLPAFFAALVIASLFGYKHRRLAPDKGLRGYVLILIPFISLGFGFLFGFFAIPYVMSQIRILKGIFHGV
jgi:hypothetical protein